MLKFIQDIHWEKALSHRSDWLNPLCIFVLGFTGLAFIYSAQSYRAGSQWITQAAWLLIGIGLYLVVSIVDYKLFLRHAHWLYLVSILGLLALWTPLGVTHFGALRWISVGPLSFQPSETAKIGTLIMAASALARAPLGPLVTTFTILTRVGGIFILPVLLIFLQPDLGSALVFPPMAFALLYISKLSERFFLTAFVVSLLSVAILGWDIYNYSRFLEEHELNPIQSAGAYEKSSWIPLHDYQRNRILSFVAPEVIDPQGIGVSWNLRQSLIAIGSGGITGQGFAQSTQARLGYLPQSVAANDFIFAVLAEEIGFLGGILIIGLYGLLACNCIRIASLARDRFGMLLCVGVSVILVVHALVNIGMTLGLMPITGVPLPFLSSGGSFVLSCCFLFGLVQSVYRFRRDFS